MFQLYSKSEQPRSSSSHVGHNGDINGFMSALAYYPADDLTVAVLINRSQIWPQTIEKAVARILKLQR